MKYSTRAEVMNNYYQLASLVSSNGCNVMKKMAGSWMKCGFLDGEKLLCMDNLYNAIQNGTCLVYSFGLADDWDFEIFMAKLGKYRKMHTVTGDYSLTFTIFHSNLKNAFEVCSCNSQITNSRGTYPE